MSARQDGATRVPGEALADPAGVRADPVDAPWGPSRGAGSGHGRARPTVGVLALQGDVLEHLRLLEAAGAHAVPVRRAEELDVVHGLLLPGGESTTIGRLLDLFALAEPLRARLAAGLPAFGTCAGAILLGRATTLDDGAPSDQPLLGALDVVTRRNAFGRQVASFEADLAVDEVPGGPLHAVFIRAPWFEALGASVRALATVTTAAGDRAVVVRQGGLLASAFHPELTGDARLHERFVSLVREAA